MFDCLWIGTTLIGSDVLTVVGICVLAVLALWIGLLKLRLYRCRADESNLRNRNSELELIAESARIGVWSIDLAKNRVRRDSSWYDLTGYSVEDFGETEEVFWSHVHPDDVAERRAQRERLEQHPEEEMAHEFRFRHASGEWIWIYTRARFTDFDADGNPTRLQGMDQNIQELHTARDAGVRSEREKLLILNSVPEAILYLDRDLRVLWANGNGEELFGKSPAGLTCHSLWHRTDKPCQNCTVQRSLKLKRPLREEMAMSDGRFFDVNVAPVVDSDGELQGCVQVASDVTHEREVEEQLRQSQKMEVVGRLAGGIAHDFNNLLQVIIGYGELASAYESDPEQAAHMRAILAAAERGESLIKQLLSFSRKKSDRQVVVSLNDILDPLIPMLGKLIGEDVKLDYFPGEDIPDICANVTELERVILNLAANARDAMPGGGTLSLATYCQEVVEDAPPPHPTLGPGEYAVLRVADSGCGMPSDVVAHAFDPFFTTKSEGKGAGLGLTAVYTAISGINGVIDLDSEEGVGTTFTFYIPRTVREALPVNKRQAAQCDGTDLTGCNILVVEDEDEVRDLSKRVLESVGCNVVTAVDGADAIEKLRERAGSLDLVMLDVVMPNVGGAEVAATAKQLCPSLPILVCSAYAEQGPNRNDEFENARFLSKPYSRAVLLAEIDEILKRQRVSSDGVSALSSEG